MQCLPNSALIWIQMKIGKKIAIMKLKYWRSLAKRRMCATHLRNNFGLENVSGLQRQMAGVPRPCIFYFVSHCNFSLLLFHTGFIFRLWRISIRCSQVFHLYFNYVWKRKIRTIWQPIDIIPLCIYLLLFFSHSSLVYCTQQMPVRSVCVWHVI